MGRVRFDNARVLPGRRRRILVRRVAGGWPQSVISLRLNQAFSNDHFFQFSACVTRLSTVDLRNLLAGPLGRSTYDFTYRCDGHSNDVLSQWLTSSLN